MANCVSSVKNAPFATLFKTLWYMRTSVQKKLTGIIIYCSVERKSGRGIISVTSGALSLYPQTRAGKFLLLAKKNYVAGKQKLPGLVQIQKLHDLKTIIWSKGYKFYKGPVNNFSLHL